MECIGSRRLGSHHGYFPSPFQDDQIIYWCVLRWLLILSQWIIPENSLRLAQVRSCQCQSPLECSHRRQFLWLIFEIDEVTHDMFQQEIDEFPGLPLRLPWVSPTHMLRLLLPEVSLVPLPDLCRPSFGGAASTVNPQGGAPAVCSIMFDTSWTSVDHITIV